MKGDIVIYNIWFTLISEKRKAHFSISSSNEVDVGQSFLEIASVFKAEIDDKNHRVNLDSLQINDITLRENIRYYVDCYQKLNPKINKLNDFMKNLAEGEKFYILPLKDISQEQHIEIVNELMCINKGIDYTEFNNKVGLLMSDFYSKYFIDGVEPDINSNKKIKIGEAFKPLRICRFCKNTRTPKTTYNIEAHAISESLGNKKIILNEECDACNNYFGHTIERDIYNYLSMYLVAFRVKNSNNNTPKLKGTNFLFYANKDNEQDKINYVLQYYSERNENDESSPPKELTLCYNSDVSLQNVYKALVKYAISVIHDQESLKGLEKTIEWISSDIYHPSLPKIATIKNYDMFSKEPGMIVHRRKTVDSNIPFAFAQFSFTFLKFVFIIPTFNDNEIDFTAPGDFLEFWNSLTHYNALEGWIFEDFSDYESKPFKINMIINPKDI